MLPLAFWMLIAVAAALPMMTWPVLEPPLIVVLEFILLLIVTPLNPCIAVVPPVADAPVPIVTLVVPAALVLPIPIVWVLPVLTAVVPIWIATAAAAVPMFMPPVEPP